MKLETQQYLTQPLLKNLSPSAGFVCSIILVLGTTVTRSLLATSILLLFALCLTLWKNNIKQLRPILLSANGFMLIVWLTLPFIISKEPSRLLPSIELSYPHIHLALLLTLKTNAILLFLLNFISTDPHNLGRLLQSIKLPHKLITLFILLYQHSLFLHKDLVAALQSLSLRAQKLNIITSFKIYAALIATTFVHCMDRARNVSMVLVQRSSPLLYVKTEPLVFKRIDIIVSVITLIFTTLIAWYLP